MNEQQAKVGAAVDAGKEAYVKTPLSRGLSRVPEGGA